jgi:hypothetical protein
MNLKSRIHDSVRYFIFSHNRSFQLASRRGVAPSRETKVVLGSAIMV